MLQFQRSSTSSDSDDAPPALNMSCNQMTVCFLIILFVFKRSQPMLGGLSQPPQGLVQAPHDIYLSKPRSGVGAILARRKIRGSFTV